MKNKLYIAAADIEKLTRSKTAKRLRHIVDGDTTCGVLPLLKSLSMKTKTGVGGISTDSAFPSAQPVFLRAGGVRFELDPGDLMKLAFIGLQGLDLAAEPETSELAS